MKFIVLLATLLAAIPPVFAADHSHHAAPGDKPDAQAAPVASAREKADYPLDVCAVSSEELGSMGEPFDYFHQEAGKPDRLVRMCCEGCVKKFKKEPAKYLARIDAAAKQKDTPADAALPANLYTCPMASHADVVSDKPGKCDKCAMTLVPTSKVKHGRP